MNVRSSPYQGIRHYEEKDLDWFFGRSKERQVVISNLFASPLTVYYGASGVGKTSLLLADVVPVLKGIKIPPEVTEVDRKRYERAIVVVIRKWQDRYFEKELRTSVMATVAEAIWGKAGDSNADHNPEKLFKDLALPLAETLGEPVPQNDEGVKRIVLKDSSLVEFMDECCRLAKRRIFLIFDQFEEYFRYHARSPERLCFDAQFASLVNNPDVPTTVLVSLREDGLSKLDRLQARIPHLLANLLRLGHLDAAGIREAIKLPLKQFNRQRWEAARQKGKSAPPKYTVDPLLVEELVKEVSPNIEEKVVDSSDAGEDELEAVEGGGDSNEPDSGMALYRDADRYSGASYLQLLLSIAWRELQESGELELKIDTIIRAAQRSTSLNSVTTPEIKDGRSWTFGAACRQIAESYVSQLMDKGLIEEWVKLSGKDLIRYARLDVDRMRNVAARLVTFLVTPGAAKMAHSVRALHRFVNPSFVSEARNQGRHREIGRREIFLTLEFLRRLHLFNRVEVGPTIAGTTYEVAHDVLGGPLNKWREAHEREIVAKEAQERAREEEKARQEELLQEHQRQLNNARAAQAEEASRLAELRASNAGEEKRLAEIRAAQADREKRLAEVRAAQAGEATRLADLRAAQASEANRLANQQAIRAEEERNWAVLQAEQAQRAKGVAIRWLVAVSLTSVVAIVATVVAIKAMREANRAKERLKSVRAADKSYDLLVAGDAGHDSPNREDYALARICALASVISVRDDRTLLTTPNALKVLRFTTFDGVAGARMSFNIGAQPLNERVDYFDVYLPALLTRRSDRLITLDGPSGRVPMVWTVKDGYIYEFSLPAADGGVAAMATKRSGNGDILMLKLDPGGDTVECDLSPGAAWKKSTDDSQVSWKSFPPYQTKVNEGGKIKIVKQTTYFGYSLIARRWIEDALADLRPLQPTNALKELKLDLDSVENRPMPGFELERVRADAVRAALDKGAADTTEGAKQLSSAVSGYLNLSVERAKEVIQSRGKAKRREEALKLIARANGLAKANDKSAIGVYGEAKGLVPDDFDDLVPETEFIRYEKIGRFETAITAATQAAAQGDLKTAEEKYTEAMETEPNLWKERNPNGETITPRQEAVRSIERLFAPSSAPAGSSTDASLNNDPPAESRTR